MEMAVIWDGIKHFKCAAILLTKETGSVPWLELSNEILNIYVVLTLESRI